MKSWRLKKSSGDVSPEPLVWRMSLIYQNTLMRT